MLSIILTSIWLIRGRITITTFHLIFRISSLISVKLWIKRESKFKLLIDPPKIKILYFSLKSQLNLITNQCTRLNVYFIFKKPFKLSSLCPFWESECCCYCWVTRLEPHLARIKSETKFQINLLTTVMSDVPVLPDEDDEDALPMLMDSPQCVAFGIFVIWWAEPE